MMQSAATLVEHHPQAAVILLIALTAMLVAAVWVRGIDRNIPGFYRNFNGSLWDEPDRNWLGEIE